MDTSDDQFEELMAQLTVRVNKMLTEDNCINPIGLMINKNKEIEISLAVSEEIDDIAEAINILQADLTSKAESGKLLATCIAYPDYENNVVIALLENNENYCAEVKIPVNIENQPILEPENVEIEDGNVYIFPICK